jgi:hypothetical protein
VIIRNGTAVVITRKLESWPIIPFWAREGEMDAKNINVKAINAILILFIAAESGSKIVIFHEGPSFEHASGPLPHPE